MSKKTIRRCIARVLKFGVPTITLLLAVWLYNPVANNPNIRALAALGSGYDAEIIRDEWGVPHISGKRDADVSFGLAYAHAEDDFETIQETVAATRGVLAHYRGKSAAPTDYIVGLLGVWQTIDARYENDVPDDVKAIAEGYAAGLNLYSAQNPDDIWPGLAPFKAEDVIAGFVFKTPFFYGLDKTLLALFDDERMAEVALRPNADGQAWQVQEKTALELGSNAIAVSAKRSGDNTTRLLINSHQPMTGPVAWYEAHLKSDQGLDIMGGLFPGTPVILHGFNQKLGWANTVNHIDLADSYLLTRNPHNSMQYLLDGEWRDFDVQEVEIMVKLAGPFAFKAKRKVLRSEHGPVIESEKHTYALRYAGIGEIRQLEQYYRFNQAQNINDFMRAMQMNALPSINYVYADRDDNISFIHNAQFPARDNQWDWSMDLPGDRSDLIWQGYRKFDQTPVLTNPQSGLIFNANNTPYVATDGADNLTRDSFPQSMGLSDDHTNRSLRLIELTQGLSNIDKATLLDIKYDHVYSVDSDQYKSILKIIDMDWSHAPELAAAVDHLKDWDRATDVENRHAALAALVFQELYAASDYRNYRNHAPDVLEQALSNATSLLIQRFGRLDPQWGEVNRLVRGELDLPIDGGPDVLRAIYSLGLEDNQTYATHGDTWMALVEWPKNQPVSAQVLHQFGSATLDQSSPHYADQAPLFADKQWRRAEFDFAKLRSGATSIYSPASKN